MKWSATPNHVAIVVDDLDAAKQGIKAAGVETFNHANDDPGRRFHFRDGDGIEFEVVSDT
ncbi:VOC family protein [Thalassospira lucentensis]|uniref:VOC family protein n=1 Tax=Thalassospira lucentensis TaxID=168935 RepID=UPI00158A6EC1|nr:VOC family protein [Thalassospira lucentensis]